MNSFYIHFLKRVNQLLFGLLAMLGFACSDDEQNNHIICEYGTPYATFEVKGKVVDKAGKPIPNIQIRTNMEDEEKASYYTLHTDTITTQSDGTFEWKTTDYLLKSTQYRLISEDIDEENNGGTFASDTSFIDFKGTELVGADSWFLGKATKEMTITLQDYVDSHTEPYAKYTIYGQVTDQNNNPMPGIFILTDPAYKPNTGDDPANYLAITDIYGRYAFTCELESPAEHLIYTKPHSSYEKGIYTIVNDTISVNFADIELTGGKGLLKGKDSKEVNFRLKI